MDLFGAGAKARVKALEEALARECERSDGLLKQVIALSDAKAFQTLHPPPQSHKPAAERAGVSRPTERPNVEAVIAAHRNNLRDKRAL